MERIWLVGLVGLVGIGCATDEPITSPYSVNLDFAVDTSEAGIAHLRVCASVDSPLCLAEGEITATVGTQTIVLGPGADRLDFEGALPITPTDVFVEMTWTGAGREITAIASLPEPVAIEEPAEGQRVARTGDVILIRWSPAVDGSPSWSLVAECGDVEIQLGGSISTSFLEPPATVAAIPLEYFADVPADQPCAVTLEVRRDGRGFADAHEPDFATVTSSARASRSFTLE